MSGLNDVTYLRRNGNVGRGALNADGISGYVMNGGATAPSGLAFGAIAIVYTLADVEALGITAAYDTTNNVMCHHHFQRHFFRNPRVETHIMLVAQSITLTQMADKANSYAKLLLQSGNGKIKLLGLIRNPASGYTATILNGMDADSYNAMAKAQQLIEDEFAALRLCPCAFVEIRSLSGTASTVYDMTTLTARNVTPVILQDPDAAAVNALFAGYAAVGDVVGLASKAAISQNIGETSDAFQLQSAANGYYIKCGTSSGQNVTIADLVTLMAKGYCFGQAVVDFDGFYLNDFPTAIPLTDDYCYGYLNRVSFKALQVVRQRILPLVRNGKLQTTPAGLLTDAFRGYLEEVATDELQNKLEATGDATPESSNTYIDPTINVRTSNGAFTIQIGFTEITLGKQITLSVGLNPTA